MTETAPGLSRRSFVQATAAATLLAVLGRPGVAYAAETEPEPGAAARTLPLSADWLFGGEFSSGSDQPGFDDGQFERVTLPHTVTPLSWQKWDPTSWEKNWIYRRHFDIPAELAGLRLFADFDGALTGATVAVNGQVTGRNQGGYLPFSHEITDLVQAKDNVLAVRLDSTFGIDVPPDRPGQASVSVDFWQPGGIYRQARLRAVPQIFVADVFARPTNVLDAAQRAVEVQVTLDAAAAAAAAGQRTRVVAELRDGPATIASSAIEVAIPQPGQTTVTTSLTGLDDIVLWDVDRPRLYGVVVTLEVGGAPLHDYGVRIGFRDARFTKEGFFLNGRRLQLFGLNRHQFFPFAGGAMPDRVQRKDAEILRNDLNCTIVRCSHYPQSEAFLDACDELGLLVWEEAPGWGYLGDDAWKDAAVRDVGTMVRRDRNHPSIVIWGSRLNETADDVPFYTRTNDLAHSLDPSRPTVGAMNGKHNTPNYVEDVFSQNDYSSSTGPDGKKRPELQAPRTDRPYLVSEAVGALSGPAKYYRRTEPQDVQQGQATAHARVHNIAASDDRYCGLIAWGGYDYPSGNGNQFQGVKYIGVADLFRVLKPGAAIYQSQVDPADRPVIQPAFYWDFGPVSPVTGLSAAMICSNLDRLEIYVGDRHHATVTPDTTGYGNLAYPPSFVDFSGVDGSLLPELRIDGYLGDRQVASRSFSADPAGDRLLVEADDQELVGDGSDATRVVFRAVDKYGAPRPYAGGQVELFVSGPAALVGDNPFPFADTGGAAAVWIRTLRNSPGTVTVRAVHPTLGSAQVDLRVRQTVPGGPPVPYGTLSVQATPGLVLAGDSIEIAGAFTNNGNPTLQRLALTVQAPDGWQAVPTTPTAFTAVQSGKTLQVGWRVTAPADAAPGQTATIKVTAAYTGHDEQNVSHAQFDLQVPHASFTAARNNRGITDDNDIDAGDFDGVGNTYSSQALASAGLARGASVTHDGLTFTWPDTSSGELDNVIATGQTIALSGSGTKIGFIGASSSTSLSGTGTIHYTDGSTSDFPLLLENYWAAPEAGNETVAATSYCNSKGTEGRPRGQRPQPLYLFYTKASIDANRTVAAVTLPAGSFGSGRITAMHVFATAIG
ncbi:glycoside hydrolase family 2 TIM barrel-domain containing protein [Streptacidiphilus griseoplanus]|uniref:glycoside hydrolase family 2 TIM barrel-domain containing protein n=1 Tax=Peterkaempfera griseoplana TaxID=66896 RepID=UPI0007C81E04|nr:glycoside hydrolase family 2 TIM barrel-domain containing protein [Peterkaempfera griseoplana]